MTKKGRRGVPSRGGAALLQRPPGTIGMVLSVRARSRSSRLMVSTLLVPAALAFRGMLLPVTASPFSAVDSVLAWGPAAQLARSPAASRHGSIFFGISFD